MAASSRSLFAAAILSFRLPCHPFFQGPIPPKTPVSDGGFGPRTQPIQGFFQPLGRSLQIPLSSRPTGCQGKTEHLLSGHS